MINQAINQIFRCHRKKIVFSVRNGDKRRREKREISKTEREKRDKGEYESPLEGETSRKREKKAKNMECK